MKIFRTLRAMPVWRRRITLLWIVTMALAAFTGFAPVSLGYRVASLILALTLAAVAKRLELRYDP